MARQGIRNLTGRGEIAVMRDDSGLLLKVEANAILTVCASGENLAA